MPTRDRFSVSRRSLLIGGANIVAAGTFLSALGPLARAADAKPIKVGFSLCGDPKRLWIQSVVCRRGEAHCAIASRDRGRAGESAGDCGSRSAMESMIRLDNCKALFPTSFGFWPFIQKIAPKYPDVLFVHAGGLWKEGDA